MSDSIPLEGRPEEDAVKNECRNASSLVPSYLDGELSEEQAAPLRAHFFACPACREVAKGEKKLKRWFVAGEAPAVPEGFAARVARRAFAGDPGLTPVAPPAVPASERGRETPILPFVLKLVAAAAVTLFVLSIAIQNRSLPAGDDLEALSPPPWEEESTLRLRAGHAAVSGPEAARDRAATDEAADEATAPTAAGSESGAPETTGSARR